MNEKLLNIRNEIAAEMHDDLGSGLSTIRLMSEMAKIGIVQPEKKNVKSNASRNKQMT